jgi:hypothetical protein
MDHHVDIASSSTNASGKPGFFSRLASWWR